MGFLDRAKDAVGEHADQVKQGLDKAEDLANQRTGGKYADQLDKVGTKADEFVDSARQDAGRPTSATPEDAGGPTSATPEDDWGPRDRNTVRGPDGQPL